MLVIYSEKKVRKFIADTCQTTGYKQFYFTISLIAGGDENIKDFKAEIDFSEKTVSVKLKKQEAIITAVPVVDANDHEEVAEVILQILEWLKTVNHTPKAVSEKEKAKVDIFAPFRKDDPGVF